MLLLFVLKRFSQRCLGKSQICDMFWQRLRYGVCPCPVLSAIVSKRPRDHFRRVRKIAKSDCQLCHVSPSIRLSAWNVSAPTGRFFMKFNAGVFFESMPRKLKFLLKSGENNEVFTGRPVYFIGHSSLSSS